MRKLFVAGNWKMNTTLESAKKLAAGVAAATAGNVDVLVAPPFPYLLAVKETLAGSAVLLGAQNAYFAAPGAFTGEVSLEMLKDVGCQHVILGHSERRQVFQETDGQINSKVKATLAAGLKVILCVGELLSEREGGKTESVLERQMTGGLEGITPVQMADIVIAYEPVWAIGTGKTATSAQAEETHAWLRSWLSGRFGGAVAEQTRIQYGGSVKPENAAELMSQPNVDGALVGGASLKVESFVGIIQAAAGIRR